MTSRRLLTVGPAHEPLWLRLFLHQLGDRWAAMILADDAPPPAPGTVKGLGLFADMPEEAEHAARVYLGCVEPTN